MAALGEGWGLQIIEAQPAGPITDATQPYAVRVRVPLNNDTNPVVRTAWALAWTHLQVLVYWRDPRVGPILVWLPARRVRHRDSPVRDE